MTRNNSKLITAIVVVCIIMLAFYMLWQLRVDVRTIADARNALNVLENKNRHKSVSIKVNTHHVSSYSVPLKNCIVTKFSTQPPEIVWKNFSDFITDCVAKNSRIREEDFVTFKTAQFDGERKFFLPPDLKSDVFRKKQCYQMTIGVGGDTSAEKEFHTKYPICKMFGLEASEESQGDFATFGSVIPAAVGVVPGELKMALRDKNDAYSSKTIPVVPLHQLMDTHIGSRLVHFIAIDIEGFEYEIMNAFRRNGTFFNEKVVFCQVDSEFHIPKMWAGNDFKFHEYFLNLLKESHFVPIHVDKKFGDHKKVVLIDTHNPECEEWFKFSLYFHNNKDWPL